MMPRFGLRAVLRFAPAVLVAVLFVASALAPARPAGSIENCGVTLQSQSGNTTGWFWQGITQPVATVGNIAACSLLVDPSGTGGGRFSIVLWDPVALVPEPTTAALRSVSFGASDLLFNHLRADFVPPVIVRQIDHLAEPPRTTVAADYFMPWYAQQIHYDPDAPAAAPVTYVYTTSSPRTPAPGSHGVVQHLVCGGDQALQTLEVVQSVMTTNALLDPNAYDAIQRFRVPERVSLAWVELAFAQGAVANPTPGTIAIYDATGQSTPPEALPASLVEANFQGYIETPRWASHFAFDHTIVLEPNHDYWLLARVAQQYQIHMRTLTGAEGPDFSANIGPAYQRFIQGGVWQPLARVLDFRLIGTPQPTSGVPVTGAARTLALAVSPNPARGPAMVSWQGAVAPVRIEILDPRGRRVALLAQGAPARGQAMWQTSALSAIAPGVYFARATDAAGHVASARVVRTR